MLRYSLRKKLSQIQKNMLPQFLQIKVICCTVLKLGGGYLVA